jgi:prepilin-type N-terminal cleavage/methylation domain-containing protein
MCADDRVGFTLIEVLVALALSAIVVLGARELLDGMTGQTTGIVRAARTADSLANVDLSVHRIVANLALAQGDAPSFDGDERSARFESWCMTAGGWQERCAVQLVADPDSVEGVRLLGSATGPIVIGAGQRSVLRYLAEVGGGGHWVTRWQSSITPPLAIGVLTGTDTMVLRIGGLR